MCRVDHLRVYGSSVPSEFPKQVFPDATPRPAYEAVIDRRRWTISFRTIAPAAAALEHVHDPADHAPVIRALDTTHILRQMRLNPCPLFVAQPEQIPAHQFFPNTNQYRIVQTEKLMSSDPSIGLPCLTRPLIHINEVLLFRVLFHADATVSERIMAQTTLTYLEQRYAALETEIAYALVHRPTDDLVIADLTYRKLIIADEIQHNRRLVERFACASLRVRQRR